MYNVSFLYDINQTWSVGEFSNIRQHTILQKYFLWEPSYPLRDTDGRTGMTKFTITSCKWFVKALKNKEIFSMNSENFFYFSDVVQYMHRWDNSVCVTCPVVVQSEKLIAVIDYGDTVCHVIEMVICFRPPSEGLMFNGSKEKFTNKKAHYISSSLR
jgi:hypothetical protein